jgi:hypothetical protein
MINNRITLNGSILIGFYTVLKGDGIIHPNAARALDNVLRDYILACSWEKAGAVLNLVGS